MVAGLVVAVAVWGMTPAGPGDSRNEALARYGAAVWQARRDRLMSAADSFERAARLDPAAVAPRRERVRVLARLGRDPEAVRTARAVLAADPADVATAHLLAELLADAGEPAEAVAVLKRAAGHLDPDARPDRALAVLRDLATLHQKAGDPAAAVAPLKQAADLFGPGRQRVIRSGMYTAAEADAAAAESYERLGQALVKAGRAGEAADPFRAAARLAGPTDAARLGWNLSAVEQARGDPAAALRHLDGFLQLKPVAVEPYERLAALLRQAGRGGEAVAVLGKLHAADPDNVPLLAVLAAETARDPATRLAADDHFAKLAALPPDPAAVRVVVRSQVGTGRAGRTAADLDAAYRAVKDATKPAAGRQAADRARAIVDALRADPDAAAAVLRAVADGLHDGTERTHATWHALGSVAARVGKLDLAAVQFRQAVATAADAARPEAYARLIDVLRRLRKPAEVAAVCREGLRDAPTVAPAFFYYHLAGALADLDDGDGARAAADKAVALATEADRLAVRVLKVRVLTAVGPPAEAVGLCRKLLTEFDAPADRDRLRYVLAGALWANGEYAAAEELYRAILDADPDDAAANNALGYHLADQGRDLAEAERLVRRAIAADRADRRRAGDPEPDNAAYLDSLGWVLFRRGELAEARRVLERAAALPDGAADPTAWDHLGDVLFRLGDKPAARAAWQAAADRYATDPRGKREGRLDEVQKKLKRVP